MSNPESKSAKTYDVVAEIKGRLDIVDVVSEQVVLKKNGRNFWGLCPFHKEKTPSFSVNPDKGIYKCFGCGEGGDSISFLMKTGNSTFFEVIADLAKKFGLELPTMGQSSEVNELKAKIHELNKAAADFYHNLLLTDSEGQKARDYLLNRGITREIIDKFNIGFSSKQPDSLLNHLIDKHKASFDVLEKAGLISRKTKGDGFCDRFRNRIIVPILDDKGNYIAFGARALDENQNPKYLNSPDSVVFNKSRNLFALYQAKESIKTHDSVILMEGYFDVITAHAFGQTNVVATLGTALTDQHIKIMAKYTDSRRIYLAFDSDTAGVNATIRGAEIIKSAFEGLGYVRQFDENFAPTSDSLNKASCEIRVVSTNTGKDPDEFIRNEGIDAYKKLINNAPLLIDYQINRIIKSKDKIETPQDKANIIKELIPILLEIKNTIIRDEYTYLVAEKLGINQESLAIEIKKSLQNVKKQERGLTPIVKKKLEKHILAQKNLLSLFFISSDKLSTLCINNYLKEVNFTEPNFLLIKNAIENIINEINNTEELIEQLFIKLSDKEEAKQLLADIMFSLEDKKCLDERLLVEYINENIVCINRYIASKQQSELKNNYHAANKDDLSSLQLQYKVKEMIQSNKQRLESINE